MLSSNVRWNKALFTSKHNKKLPYCTTKIIFAETFLHSTHIFFTKSNKKNGWKKDMLAGKYSCGKYSRGFRKNNKNSRVFPHKNISLYSRLKKVDAMPLYGSQKAWSVQHLLLSRLTWSLMIHDLSLLLPKKWTKLLNLF